MTMTDDDKVERSAEQAAVDQLVDAGLLDELMSQVDAGELQLTGEGGFLPGLIKGSPYRYSYVAWATTPGTFVVPPAKAEELYSPEVFGRSASDRVTVFEG